MSLSQDDLQAIRAVVEETINPLRGDIEALNNDIKEIYSMISDLQDNIAPGKQFQKLSLEEKATEAKL
jgi:hypothetical protein